MRCPYCGADERSYSKRLRAHSYRHAMLHCGSRFSTKRGTSLEPRGAEVAGPRPRGRDEE